MTEKEDGIYVLLHRENGKEKEFYIHLKEIIKSENVLSTDSLFCFKNKVNTTKICYNLIGK